MFMAVGCEVRLRIVILCFRFNGYRGWKTDGITEFIAVNIVDISRT